MLIHHMQQVDTENEMIESGRNLLQEARTMAFLVMQTYFPDLGSIDEITCCNCRNFVDRGCAGRCLDFHGVIDCMVNIAINGPMAQSMLNS